MGRLRSAFMAISVEPITFFNFLGFALYAVCLQSGVYQVLCSQIIQNGNCQRRDGLQNSANEDKVQAASTFWYMMLTLAYLGPALFSDTILGALGDRQGRKTNILIGLAGMIVSYFPTIIVFSSLRGPMWLLIVFNLIAGFTGFIGIVVISAFAYLADTVFDHEDLTVRMVIMGVVNASAMVIGSFLASALLHYLSFSYIMTLGMVMISVSFFYTLFRIKQVPPVIMRAKIAKGSSKQQQLTDGITKLQSPQNHCMLWTVCPENTKNEKKTTLSSLMSTISSLLKEILVTFTKHRPFHHRRQMLFVSLVFFFHVLADMGLQGSITTLFLFRRPFSWTAEKLAFFRGFSSLVNMVGGAAGVLVFKKVFHFRESTILIIALISCTSERLMFTFSTKDWMVYTAVILGCMSTMVMPTVKSFAVLLVDPDEVGKMYTAFGVGMDLAHVVSAVMFNSVYERTFRFFPGLCFLIGASLSFLNFIIILYINIDEKRCGRVTPDSESNKTKTTHF